jgi:L-ribulose-5-phosphate 4-epimerase
MELFKNRLVTWTTGNISARDLVSGFVVIKPSGVLYGDLSPDIMVILDVQGNLIEGQLKPSSDTATHLYVYRNRPDVCGIVHTHSPFATAFAAVGRPIPASLTTICEEFGGSIPVGEFALSGGDEIGQEIVRSIGNNKAILMKNHGVFSLGRNARSALKTAVMVEDAARIMYYAYQLGEPIEISHDNIEILYRRYNEEYGQ